MQKRLAAVLGTLGLALGLAQPGSAAEMSDSYIVGVWHTEGAKCSDKSAERLEFRKGGSVEATREGETDATGFWSAEDGLVMLDVVARPELFHRRPSSTSAAGSSPDSARPVRGVCRPSA